MIDVILCCYQQEQYIAKALQSILEQAVEEKIHLIVADDGSSDNTLSIIENMLHTSQVKDIEVEILPSDKNVGMVRNYQRAFARCNGDFVMILEGDDWWISSKHIHSHVQYLREHPGISMCANAFMTYNQQSCDYAASSWGVVRTFNIHYQIVNNCLGNLSACCFRNELIKALPQSVFDLSIADYFLGIFMASFGEIALLPEPTSVWRVGVGQWTSNSAKNNREDLKRSIDQYDAFFDHRFTEDFNKAKNSKTRLHFVQTWRDLVPKAAIRIIKFSLGKL